LNCEIFKLISIAANTPKTASISWEVSTNISSLHNSYYGVNKITTSRSKQNDKCQFLFYYFEHKWELFNFHALLLHLLFFILRDKRFFFTVSWLFNAQSLLFHSKH
jgi:hypothetical protein